MYDLDDMVNTIFCGHSPEILRSFPPESVHMCMTSPPYWGKRSYKTQPHVWDGSPDCNHDFTIETEAGDIRFRHGYNSAVVRDSTPEYWEGDGMGHICPICGAWKGELGHEPTPELYIKHLVDIFDEVKRILKPSGSLWVNIGDSYYGSGGSIGQTPESKNLGRKTFEYGAFPFAKISQQEHEFLQAKSMCCIPEMFVIEMLRKGFILRNKIIWHKPNCTPESADDRFTNDFEPVYFFTRNNDNLYWTNEKTLKLVMHQPKTSIEGIDWEWQPCKRCGGTGFMTDGEDEDKCQRSLDSYFEGNGDEKTGKPEKTVCRKCSGTGKVKYSLWTGHDYYFQQQFEPYKLNRWGGKYKTNENVKTSPKEKQCGGQGSLNRQGYDCYPNPFGRNMRSVWTIKVASFKGAHFAVYPEELCVRPIQAGCPEFVCRNCGMPRVKIFKPTGNKIVFSDYPGCKTAEHIGCSPLSSLLTKQVQEKAVAGYSECGCQNPDYEPGIVLDPFSGSGTTALSALKLGRRFVGIDSNPEYVELACGRVKPYLEQKKVATVLGDNS